MIHTQASGSVPPRIALVDHQRYWIDQMSPALQAEGFAVYGFLDYDAFLAHQSSFDWMFLGCAHIGSAEWTFIREMLNRNVPIIVMAAHYTWTDERQLFLEGVCDVANKPYTHSAFLRIVHENMRKDL